MGPPGILKSESWRKFVAKVIDESKVMWPGLDIIPGRPRHPQSQGCSERGNGDLQLKLGKWLADNETGAWSKGLKFVTHAMDTSTASATKRTPYEVVFGQKLRANLTMM